MNRHQLLVLNPASCSAMVSALQAMFHIRPAMSDVYVHAALCGARFTSDNEPLCVANVFSTLVHTVDSMQNGGLAAGTAVLRKAVERAAQDGARFCSSPTDAVACVRGLTLALANHWQLGFDVPLSSGIKNKRVAWDRAPVTVSKPRTDSRAAAPFHRVNAFNVSAVQTITCEAAPAHASETRSTFAVLDLPPAAVSVSSGLATLFRQHTVPCASCTAHATVEVNVKTAPSVVVVLVPQHRQPVIDRMLVLSDGIFRAPARSAATQSGDVYSVRAVCAEVPLPAADVAATDSSATTGSSAVAATATLLYPEAADDPILVVNGIDDTGNSRVAVIVPAGAAAMFPRAIFYVNVAAHEQTRLRTQLIPETYRQSPADSVTVAASIAGGGAASAMLTAAAGGRAAASAMPTVAPASAVYAHADSASRHALYDGPAMSASSIFDVAATSLSTRAGEPPPATFTAATVADGKYVNSASRSTYGAAAAAVDFEDDDEEQYASHHLGEDSDEEHDDVGYDLAVSTGGCGVSASASASASQNVPTAGGVCFPSVPASTQAGAVGRASIGDRSAPAAHLTTSSAPTVITRTASASYAAARDASVHLAPRASLASHGGGGLHASAHARAGPSPFSYEDGVPPSGGYPMRTHGAGYGGGAHPSVAPPSVSHGGGLRASGHQPAAPTASNSGSWRPGGLPRSSIDGTRSLASVPAVIGQAIATCCSSPPRGRHGLQLTIPPQRR